MSRRVHDAVARGYNSDSGIIAAKNRTVAAALQARWGARRDPLRVADLGVGDGALLAQLAALKLPMRMTGLDISPAMLRLAAGRVPMTPVRGSAAEALEYLPAGQFDLVLSHFIFAYVDRAQLLSQACGLLARGGILSVVTSTDEGGAPFHEGLERVFRHSRNPLRRAIGWAADRALAASHVPRDFATLAADIESAGLAVLARRTLRTRVVFHGPDDAYRFGVEEGWAAGMLAVPGVPLRLAQAVVRWGTRQYEYPFEFTHVTEIVDAGRAAEHQAGAIAADTSTTAASASTKILMPVAQMSACAAGHAG